MNFRYAIPPEHGKRLERLAQGNIFNISICKMFEGHTSSKVKNIVLDLPAVFYYLMLCDFYLSMV